MVCARLMAVALHCLAMNSLNSLGSAAPTFANRPLRTLSSFCSRSHFFVSRSFSVVSSFTRCSVSACLIFALSRDFLTATLFLSLRCRYSSESLSRARFLPLLGALLGAGLRPGAAVISTGAVEVISASSTVLYSSGWLADSMFPAIPSWGISTTSSFTASDVLFSEVGMIC